MSIAVSTKFDNSSDDSIQSEDDDDLRVQD